MDIYDYQVKQIFRQAGIEVPAGYVAYTPKEAEQTAVKIGGAAWVVKAQIYGVFGQAADALEGKRWVEEAKTLAAVSDISRRMLDDVIDTDIGQQRIKKVYVEEKCDIDYKVRLSVQIDFGRQAVIFVIKDADGKVFRYPVPDKGMTGAFIKKCLSKIKAEPGDRKTISDVVQKLYHIFRTYDLVAAEVNPLAKTKDGKIVALEGRMIFDEDALFKVPQVAHMKEVDVGTERERVAAQNNFRYYPMNGNIACLVNGSGLGLATFDMVRVFKGDVACLLDVGMAPGISMIARAIRLVLSEPDVEGVLVNIFGGTIRCDVIAGGLIAAAKEISVGMPIVVRMDGTNAKVGERLLLESGLPFIVTHTMEESVKKVIECVGELA